MKKITVADKLDHINHEIAQQCGRKSYSLNEYNYNQLKLNLLFDEKHKMEDLIKKRRFLSYLRNNY